MFKKLHYFNPGHESAVYNASPYYMAPANVAKLQQDLEYLPAWYAEPDDYVLCQNKETRNFTDYLLENEIKIAQSVIPGQLQALSSDFAVFPWGISPQVIHFFNEVSKNFSVKCQLSRWNSKLTDLTSRINAIECLKFLSYRIQVLDDTIVPQVCRDLSEIEAFVEKTDYQLLAKAPFSSSGRGLLWLPVGNLTRTERQILHGIIKKQGNILIERALNRAIDFAMEFFVSETGEVSFEGYSLFETSSKGGYIGNILDNQTNILAKIAQSTDIQLLEKVKTNLSDYIKNKFSTLYSGYIGVDMMIYEEKGICKLHPCVEMNVRNNMGVVAIKICENYLHPHSKGMYFVDFNAQAGKIYESDRELRHKYPAYFSDGKVKSGYLSLCPVGEETKYRAYILIEEK